MVAVSYVFVWYVEVGFGGFGAAWTLCRGAACLGLVSYGWARRFCLGKGGFGPARHG